MLGDSLGADFPAVSAGETYLAYGTKHSLLALLLKVETHGYQIGRAEGTRFQQQLTARMGAANSDSPFYFCLKPKDAIRKSHHPALFFIIAYFFCGLKSLVALLVTPIALERVEFRSNQPRRVNVLFRYKCTVNSSDPSLCKALSIFFRCSGRGFFNPVA